MENFEFETELAFSNVSQTQALFNLMFLERVHLLFSDIKDGKF